MAPGRATRPEVLDTLTIATRRPAAATITWVMMFVGFVITTAVAGQMLDPYSHERLVVVVALICMADTAITALAVWGIEARVSEVAPVAKRATVGFREALKQVWRERQARRFTIFVFVSMLAYSGQELLLEPFDLKVQTIRGFGYLLEAKADQEADA